MINFLWYLLRSNNLFGLANHHTVGEAILAKVAEERAAGVKNFYDDLFVGYSTDLVNTEIMKSLLGQKSFRSSGARTK